MAGTLVIVESPTKARTISRYLGEGFEVQACSGHIRDLPKGSFGVDVDNDFEPTYVIMSDSRSTVGKLRKSAKEADVVYLAPDPDREGEAIAWHLVQALGLPEGKVRRATFHEITRDAVHEAFQSPGSVNMDLVNAQQARRILDRIVGYELSPLISRKIARGLSAGRVQSVTLRLVVEREREIERFEQEEYWQIVATLARQGGGEPFEAELRKLDGEDLAISSQEQADAAVARLKEEGYGVLSVEKRQSRSRPSAPFITSTLQQAASGRLGLSPAQTMRIAQQLYEGVEVGGESEGLITYMRTDSTRVSDRAIEAVRKLVTEQHGAQYLPSKPNTFKSPAAAQEAHEAVRPTDPARTPDSVKSQLSDRQWKLYDLIWRRFVASQMKPAVFDVTRVEIGAGCGLFLARGRVMVFDGHTRVMKPEAADGDQLLPDLAQGDGLDLRELVPSQHFTQPPPRFTEASLVRELERLGIGRPSTYAPTISTLQKRNYVRRKRRTLTPTQLGCVVTDKLVAHFPREVDYGFTKDLEDKLDLIEEGKADWRETLREFYDKFSRDLASARENMTAIADDDLAEPRTCEKCGKKMIARFSRLGDMFLGCSGYPECDNTFSLDREQGEETEHKCPKCGSPMLQKTSRRDRPYLACSGYPECDHAMGLDREGKPVELAQRSATGMTCPRCGGRLYTQEGEGGTVVVCGGCRRSAPLVTLEDALVGTEPEKVIEGELCEECGSPVNMRRSRGGFFLGCSRYPDCEASRPLDKDRFPDPVPTQELCDLCGEVLVLRWGRYGRFLACSGYPGCRNTWQLSASMPPCPKDGCEGRLVRKVQSGGKDIRGCTRFPACDYTCDAPPRKKRAAPGKKSAPKKKAVPRKKKAPAKKRKKA